MIAVETSKSRESTRWYVCVETEDLVEFSKEIEEGKKVFPTLFDFLKLMKISIVDYNKQLSSNIHRNFYFTIVLPFGFEPKSVDSLREIYFHHKDRIREAFIIGQSDFNMASVKKIMKKLFIT